MPAIVAIVANAQHRSRSHIRHRAECSDWFGPRTVVCVCARVCVCAGGERGGGGAAGRVAVEIAAADGLEGISKRLVLAKSQHHDALATTGLTRWERHLRGTVGTEGVTRVGPSGQESDPEAGSKKGRREGGRERIRQPGEDRERSGVSCPYAVCSVRCAVCGVR